ncbi:hypothetical protein DIPPA_04674 [Diplonema papillatum]|nr:hypothetical protein DIPPA_04674 [Diplonema papillatum]
MRLPAAASQPGKKQRPGQAKPPRGSAAESAVTPWDDAADWSTIAEAFDFRKARQTRGRMLSDDDVTRFSAFVAREKQSGTEGELDGGSRENEGPRTSSAGAHLRTPRRRSSSSPASDKQKQGKKPSVSTPRTPFKPQSLCHTQPWSLAKTPAPFGCKMTASFPKDADTTRTPPCSAPLSWGAISTSTAKKMATKPGHDVSALQTPQQKPRAEEDTRATPAQSTSTEESRRDAMPSPSTKTDSPETSASTGGTRVLLSEHRETTAILPPPKAPSATCSAAEDLAAGSEMLSVDAVTVRAAKAISEVERAVACGDASPPAFLKAGCSGQRTQPAEQQALADQAGLRSSFEADRLDGLRGLASALSPADASRSRAAREASDAVDTISRSVRYAGDDILTFAASLVKEVSTNSSLSTELAKLDNRLSSVNNEPREVKHPSFNALPAGIAKDVQELLLDVARRSQCVFASQIDSLKYEVDVLRASVKTMEASSKARDGRLRNLQDIGRELSSRHGSLASEARVLRDSVYRASRTAAPPIASSQPANPGSHRPSTAAPTALLPITTPIRSPASALSRTSPASVPPDVLAALAAIPALGTDARSRRL